MPPKSVAKKENNPETYNGCVWDITIWDKVDDVNADTVKPISKDIEIWLRDCFSKFTKAYGAQVEECPSSKKLHLQCRISLKEKTRKSALIKLINQYFKSYRISLTSNENRKNLFYVMKEDSRILGPWLDTDPCTHIKIPSDVRAMKTLLPFQGTLATMSRYQSPFNRWVDNIVEIGGGIGKTAGVRWLRCYEDVGMIPAVFNAKDLTRMSYCIGEKKTYVIDMPRAMDKSKLNEFYAAIEQLKSGYAYDDRNKFKDLIMDRPNVFIFSNTWPDENLLSKDMWRFWTINSEKELVRVYNMDQVIDINNKTTLLNNIDNESPNPKVGGKIINCKSPKGKKKNNNPNETFMFKDRNLLETLNTDTLFL